jgi:hypothetical protein
MINAAVAAFEGEVALTVTRVHEPTTLVTAVPVMSEPIWVPVPSYQRMSMRALRAVVAGWIHAAPE